METPWSRARSICSALCRLGFVYNNKQKPDGLEKSMVSSVLSITAKTETRPQPSFHVPKPIGTHVPKLYTSRRQMLFSLSCGCSYRCEWWAGQPVARRLQS